MELLEASGVPEIPINPYGAVKKGTLQLRICLRKALLIVEPKSDSVLVFRRLGLFFLTDRTWFDLSSSVLNTLDEGTGGALSPCSASSLNT
jgi:hypothetical protein